MPQGNFKVSACFKQTTLYTVLSEYVYRQKSYLFRKNLESLRWKIVIGQVVQKATEGVV